jgi:raffinose/stachyose/melibiose transport system substrate-binding protein
MSFKKVFASLLAAAMLVGCGSGSGSSTTDGAAAGGDTGASGEGRVYFLNFKPELDETLQELAKTYTAEKGVEVQVVTAASGTYSQTLTAEMD